MTLPRTVQGVSTLSTYSLEEVAAAGQAANIPSLWFQLYVNVDRSFTRDLIASEFHRCSHACS